MELHFSWLILIDVLVIFIGSCFLFFGFLRKANDLYYGSKLGEKRQFLPPGDMGWPLIGNIWSYYKAFKSDNPETFILNLVKRYGRSVMYKNHLFGSPCGIIVTPEACRQIFLDDENFKFGYPPATSKLTFRGSLGSASREEQKRIRRQSTTPIKGHKAIAIYVGNTEEIMLNSLNEWARISCLQEKPIEFLSEMRKATFKVIANIFLGSSCSDSRIELMEKYYADYSSGLLTPWAINFPGFTFHKAMKARDMLGEILERALNERRAMKQKERRGLIDLLIEVDDENGTKLADIDIIDILISFLSAGHESTAHVGMWAIRFLHQHPKLLQKAKEEQEGIIKRRSFTQKGLSIEEIKQMQYLTKVIDETLRLVNLTPASFRETNADVNVQGYTIPKGWKVLLYNRGVHLDPENYPNPKEFNPSRWDPTFFFADILACNKNPVTRPGAFIPFGGGQRICPGADLAKVEISIFLHYFLLYYKLELINPECPTEYFPITRPTDKCLAKVIKLK